MTIKTLLMSAVAALVTITTAQAADAIVASEPEGIEYVRVCDAFGKGFFYIPGTETCLKIGGYIRFDSNIGESPFNGSNIGWNNKTRATFTFDARNDTEYGALRSFIEIRQDVTRSTSTAILKSGYIELAGFRAGFSDSRFDTWLKSTGNIINDDVIDYSPSRTNQFSYIYGGEKGFALLVGAEEGSGAAQAGDDFAYPLAGARLVEDWGGLYGIAGYDTKADSFAGKLRADAKFGMFTVFLIGGYQSDWDNTKGDGGARQRNFFGSWNGDWAAWGGIAAKVSEKASVNFQGAYEEDGTYAAALNVDYKLVSGLKIQPELTYTNFDGLRGDGDAFGGTLRIQRDF